MASRGKQCVTELGHKTSEALCGTHHFHKVHPQLSTHSLLRADAHPSQKGQLRLGSGERLAVGSLL